jgi:hypothetical protein
MGAIQFAAETIHMATFCTLDGCVTGDSVASCGLDSRETAIGPEGFEPPQETSEKTTFLGSGGARGGARDHDSVADRQLQDVIDSWSSLSQAARNAVLELVRREVGSHA